MSADWERIVLSSASEACGWIRTGNCPHDVIQTIYQQLSQFTGTSREMFRQDVVYDETTKAPQPHALQRLVRWNTMHPKEVFLRGFEPRYKTNDVTHNEAFHLEHYASLASKDTARIFVSTSRPYRLPSGKYHTWRPLFVDTEFAYDVYAYGGIDINQVIPGNQFGEEREISFPGGIHWESIQLAREFSDGQLIAVWWNARFDVSVIAGLSLPKVPPDIDQYHFDPTIPQA